MKNEDTVTYKSTSYCTFLLIVYQERAANHLLEIFLESQNTVIPKNNNDCVRDFTRTNKYQQVRWEVESETKTTRKTSSIIIVHNLISS